MIALRMKEVKHFMGKLLGTDSFDSFLLEEATITTYNTFAIEGRLNREYYTDDEWDDPQIRSNEFASWKTLRPICFELIKGKKTPSAFKFVFHLDPKAAQALLVSREATISADQVKALMFTCRYDSTGLTLITGTALHTFIPDKSADQILDKAFKTFLNKKEILYEEI